MFHEIEYYSIVSQAEGAGIIIQCGTAATSESHVREGQVRHYGHAVNN